jgi:opacity protein-like surface antigen
MKRSRIIPVAATLVSLGVAGATTIATAQDRASRFEVALMSGFQVLNENDTALPDDLTNIPGVATLSCHLTPIAALEGEFTWMIPFEQNVSVGSGSSQDLKGPDILAYQANARATWPVSPYWSPYAVAGAGAVTFLSASDADRLPRVDESQTMFALNFGAGVNYFLDARWGLRVDFREFVAFPADDASGLSNASGADEIWMARGTLGLAYRF